MQSSCFPCPAHPCVCVCLCAVEKGNEDGLYISSVACSADLWALIMDGGTGFTAQVYVLVQQFLPKVRACCLFRRACV